MSKLLKIFDDLVTIEIESLLNLTAPCCHSILFSTSKTNLMAIYFILFLLVQLEMKGGQLIFKSMSFNHWMFCSHSTIHIDKV